MTGMLWLMGLDGIVRFVTAKFLSPEEFTPFMKDVFFPTGSLVFDTLLRGYEGGVATTIYGPSGSGKTTVCLLAVLHTLQLGKKAIYVDCEGGFSGMRFHQLAGTDNVQLLLDRLFLLKPLSFTDQVKTINRLRDLVNDTIGLVVVDSISMHYRVALHGAEGHRVANAELSNQMAHLVEVARRHNIPILLTSQVYADFDERDNVKMVGGDILRYGSKCLLRLQKYKGVRRVSIIKHRSIAENTSALFQIVERGFEEIVQEEPKEKIKEKVEQNVDVPGFSSVEE
jgi:DNA repair protein RadB